VLAPTRELAAQIYTETKKFSKGFGLKIGAIYGGMSKFEQFKVLKAGVEAVVATPGRLIDLIKMKGTSLGAHRPAEYLAHPVSVSDSPGTSLTGVLTPARSPLHVRRVRRGGSDVEYGL
jgi:hypothetical protein